MKKITSGFLALAILFTGSVYLVSPSTDASFQDLSANLSPLAPDEDIVIAGEDGVPMTTIQLCNSGNDYEIDRFTVFTLFEQTPGDMDNNYGAITVEYETQQGAVAHHSTYPVNGEAHFAGLDIYVPAGQCTNLYFYADVNSVLYGAHAGETMMLFPSTKNLRAIDLQTGQVYAPNLTKIVRNPQRMHIQATKPTLALSALSPSGQQTVGAHDDIFAFNVTADVAGDVEIEEVTFNLSSFSDFNTGNSVVALLKDSNGTPIADGQVTFTTASQATLTVTPSMPLIVPAGSTEAYTLELDTSRLLNDDQNEDDPLGVDINLEGGFIWNDGYVTVGWLGNVANHTLSGHTLLY
ncbi:hypothetical protein KKC94_04340 [Patescibacteria group bacterium]|nr:hypothetical protein [Patescibacteria group bacterium]